MMIIMMKFVSPPISPFSIHERALSIMKLVVLAQGSKSNATPRRNVGPPPQRFAVDTKRPGGDSTGTRSLFARPDALPHSRYALVRQAI